MQEGRIVYHVAPWGDGVVVEDIVVDDHRAWALRVGFPGTLALDSALAMMRKNANVVLGYQARALREGPAFIAPLKGDDIEQLGGDSAATVSRIFNGATIRYEGDAFDAGYLLSPTPERLEVDLSGVQVRAICLAARALLGDVSDQKVSDALSRAGVPLARRTVNKYTNSPPAEVMPCARFTAMFEATVAGVRGEADLARLAGVMLEHSKTQLALLGAAADPAARRRTEVREWLLSGRVLGADAKSQFKNLPPPEQLRVVEQVLDTLDARVREAAARHAVRV